MQREEGKKFLDLKLNFGQDKGGINLAAAKLDLFLRPEQIADLTTKAGIKEHIGEDLILKFDFVTHEGRQQDAMQYFEIGFDESNGGDYNSDLSPLQNMFKRSTSQGKTQLFESKRLDNKSGVSVQYHFYKESVMKDDNDLIDLLDSFGKADFKPDLHMDIEMMGRILSNKPNRISLKIDHANFHLTSDHFRLKDFLRLLILLEFFGMEDEAEQIKTNPIFKLFENAEELQAELSMSSFSKMVELYEAGFTKNGQNEYNWQKFHQKEPPERTKGLFKDQVDITFIYGEKVAFRVECTYDSEPVMIRLLTGSKRYIEILDG